MKKILTFLFIIAAALVSRGQLINAGASTAGLVDTVVATNGVTTVYVGSAITTASKAAPSTTNPVWRITKIVSDASGNVISWGSAYTTAAGDLSLKSAVWDDRYTATYKEGQ